MKKITLILITLFWTIAAFSQNNLRDKIGDKIKIQRIAFITQRLSFTEAEAQVFWPVYNEYTEKLQQIKKRTTSEKPFDELSDADVEKTITEQFDRDAKELELKKEYFQRLKKVISVKKIAKLYRAEKDFRGELVKQLQDMKEMKKNLKRRNR